MPEYQRSLTIDASPDDLFDVLSKVENLPKFFPQLSDAHYETGDEVHVTGTLPQEMTADGAPRKVEGNAHFSVDAEHRSVAWSSDSGEHRGELQVTADGGGSRLAVTVQTQENDEAFGKGIEETLRNVQQLVTQS
jgi:uncharacterized protein YndB with AHSA1/START domain